METKTMVKISNGWAAEGDTVKYLITSEPVKIMEIDPKSELIYVAAHRNSYIVNHPDHLMLI